MSKFEQLLVSFEQAWQDDVEEHYNPGRQCRYGGGRTPQLKHSCDKLLFILVYYRLYPTQAVQGFLFSIGQPQAHEWVHKLSQVLNQALKYDKQLPERKPHRLEAVLSECPNLEFIIDGTEHRVNRPKGSAERKLYYSGKKKGFTLKNDVLAQRREKVVYLSDTFEGKKHDKAICDEESYSFLEGSKLWKDTRFQRYEPEGITTFQPKNKPCKRELSEADKQRNREISKQRIEIEHHISGIKRCKIVVHLLRSRTDHFATDVMETACGLHNFRLTPLVIGYLGDNS